jgi:hypothetical protein
MNISDINQILTQYRIKRERVVNELKGIDQSMSFWVKRREQLKDEILGTPDLFSEMFGEDATPTVPEVSYTYTDTPMAEEYYGG